MYVCFWPTCERDIVHSIPPNPPKPTHTIDMTVHLNGTVPNGGPRTSAEPTDTKPRLLVGNGQHANTLVNCYNDYKNSSTRVRVKCSDRI